MAVTKLAEFWGKNRRFFPRLAVICCFSCQISDTNLVKTLEWVFVWSVRGYRFFWIELYFESSCFLNKLVFLNWAVFFFELSCFSCVPFKVFHQLADFPFFFVHLPIKISFTNRKNFRDSVWWLVGVGERWGAAHSLFFSLSLTVSSSFRISRDVI